MNFKKRYSRITVLMAVLHGVIIGVAAVAVVGFVLTMAGKGKDKETAGEEVAAQGPPPVEAKADGSGGGGGTGETLTLYAKQHGVFSSAESASGFIAQDPALAKAAVIQAGSQYYVWSAIGLKESEIDADAAQDTFRKPFKVAAGACNAPGSGKLAELLKETDAGKIKDLATGGKAAAGDTKAAEFARNIAAVMAFTNDLQLIRLHLLSYYSHEDDCAIISF